ncbi:ATP-binding cassette sub-family C member 4-like [Cydia amplana]|uniref:ATP-binding cassette sub-family C member 4-like n=1 Tax=Cydia amplana TaxID=1869771 RepID=UPI002FE66765
MDNLSKVPKDGADKKRSDPNIISRFFICWVCPVLVKGNRRDVEEEDLIIPGKQYDSIRQGQILESYWIQEYEKAKRENRKPSLWSALRRAYWLQYMPGAIYLSINAAARMMLPIIFTELLSYWSAESTITRLEAGYYALGMLGLNFVAMMCHHHNTLFVNRFSLRVKVAATSLLYRKLLRMSQVSVGEVAAGKLVNLMSNDVARFDFALMFLHQLWVIPVQAAVVLYLLYIAAGWAPFVGLFGVVLIIIPLQAALTKLTAVVRRKTAARTDRRIKLMSEIINGIQVIKMYAWEIPFQAVVKMARSHEVASIKNAMIIRSIFLGFMLFTERTILFLTVLTLILTGSMITATTIYPIQQYFSIIQMNLTLILPFAIANLSELFVSLDRIQEILVMDERENINNIPGGNNTIRPVSFDSNPIKKEPNSVVPKKYTHNDEFTGQEPETAIRRPSVAVDYALELAGVTASWSPNGDETTLANLSIRIRKGKLCAMIGPVGSGKSSLLQVLLRELPISKGNLNVKGRLSYASQDSWLFPATVRENILFGLPFDSNKYKQVCRVCCMLPDFKQFPYGDLTLVGERGVSLSGGQKARINLARAVYREADIYLLDDPLSAVDANVGRILFEDCIKGYLHGKTVILVTHQIHFLKSADTIVVLNEGAIENVGNYEELSKSGKEFALLLSSTDENVVEPGATKLEARPSVKRGISRVSIKSESSEVEKEQIQEAEERAKGNLKWKVLWAYLSSVESWCLVATTMLVVVATQATATATDFWLSQWTNNVDAYEQSLPAGEEPDPGWNTEIGNLQTWHYLLTYGCLILGIIVILHTRIYAFVVMTVRASKNIHNTIFKNLINALMRFFDTNLSGRVLNRFSKDMGALDEILPRSMLETIQMYLSMISILVLNALALWWTIIPTFVLVIIFIILLKWYLNAAQAVKRLESTTKSPVFGMITSTISGLSTIRSSGSENRLNQLFDAAQDLHSSAFYTFLGAQSAFGLYLDYLCLAYLGTIIAVFLVVDFGELIPVGSVGLAVSQSMVLTVMLQMAARFTAEFLAQMTSVERVVEYSQLPKEENMYEGKIQAPLTWPSQGEVHFENVFMRYGPEDPPVLNDLSFQINSGWKVGVVGRTGAGKSSLISALFQLYTIDGNIKIDGVNIKDLSKQALRSKISIIPQEPILFSATLRYNLDPFDTYSDDDIWRALEQVEMKDAITSLSYKVAEGGSNFSVGQRQLLCLARAVLRSNKVLVMDEATANVDPQTDALIQSTIRRVFSTCTVITIAHRLNTVMDSDRVLVMDKGRVAEYDYPYILLKNPNSLLNFMVKETGEMGRALNEMAKAKYDSEHPPA